MSATHEKKLFISAMGKIVVVGGNILHIEDVLAPPTLKTVQVIDVLNPNNSCRNLPAFPFPFKSEHFTYLFNIFQMFLKSIFSIFQSEDLEYAVIPILIQVFSDGVGGLDANGVLVICGQHESNLTVECRNFDAKVFS